MAVMIRLLSAAALLLAGLSPVLAGAFTSTYTTHDWERCAAVPGEEGEVVQRFRCMGPARVPVIYTAEEDGSSVAFGARPLEEDYGFAGFFEAGTTVEWRGPAGGRPAAAIIRYHIGNTIGKLDRSLLVIYRIQPDGVGCILGTVRGGTTANATARTLVDGHATSFRCGKDRRIAR